MKRINGRATVMTGEKLNYIYQGGVLKPGEWYEIIQRGLKSAFPDRAVVGGVFRAGDVPITLHKGDSAVRLKLTALRM